MNFPAVPVQNSVIIFQQRHSPAKPHTQDADQDDDKNAQDQGELIVPADHVKTKVAQPADDSRGSINFLSEDQRNFIAEHIPDHAAKSS